MAKAPKDVTAPTLTAADWQAQTPCPECGGRPGYNPSSGIEMKQGHHSGCSQWKQESTT